MPAPMLVATSVLAFLLAGSASAFESDDGRAGASELSFKEEARILERYRPVLNYDEDETYFAQPVSLPPESADVVPGNHVYGHVAREGGYTWLQYWFFYAYNPQDRHPLKTGRHEGDWELAQLRLDGERRPDLSVSSQHSWAEACAWEELDLTVIGKAPAPAYYVANGSHAMYSQVGDYGRPFPDPTDEADGNGRSVRPQLTVINDGDPRWVDYEGRWGETEAGIVPGESSSPFGPRFQTSKVWTNPTSYYRDRARACGSGAPDRPWQTLALASVLALGLGAVALGVRNRG